MKTIVATEIHLRGLKQLPKFIRLAKHSRRQAEKSEGYIFGKTSVNLALVAHTLTVWESEDDMNTFRNTGQHYNAMHHIGELSYRYRTLVWQGDRIPQMKEARKLLRDVSFKIIKK